jgi:hypothetical protein
MPFCSGILRSSESWHYLAFLVSSFNQSRSPRLIPATGNTCYLVAVELAIKFPLSKGVCLFGGAPGCAARAD